MDDFLEKQMENVIKKVYLSGAPYLTHFLSSNKQELILTILKKYPTVQVKFDGGALGTEYQKAYLYLDEIEDIDFKIVTLAFKYNKLYLNINHRNVLGSLMALGLNRDRIGDIKVKDDIVMFMASTEIVPFLLENFKLMHKEPITLYEMTDKADFLPELVEKQIYASSLRSDSIISKVYNLSREESQNYFLTKLVKVNQITEQKYTKELHENDLVSVTGYGRFKISTYYLNKKQRYVITILVYK